MPKQLLLAGALLLIMAGGVAWIAFALLKATPLLGRIYGAAAAMKRRTDLLKAGDHRHLSEPEIDAIRQLTTELKGQVKGELAARLVEHELELADLAKSALASGDSERARTLLAGLRRTWP